MTAFKCDRCKKYQDGDRSYIIRIMRGTSWINSDRPEICEDCCSKLLEWLGGNDLKEVEDGSDVD